MLIDYMLNKSDNLNSINILSNLNKFMYSTQRKKLLHKQPNIFELKTSEKEVIPDNDSKNNINCYRPTQINSLFWCVFIAVHGYEEYIKVNHNYGAKELEIKQEISTALNTNKHLFKDSNYKLSQIKIKEIISDFLTTVKETNMNCLIALTIHFQINLFIVHPNSQFMIKLGNHSSNESPTYVIFKDTYDKYSIQLDALTEVDIENLYTKYFYIENYLKPIKSIATYKVDELIIIAKKINIYDNKQKYKKQELYNIVFNFVKWF